MTQTQNKTGKSYILARHIHALRQVSAVTTSDKGFQGDTRGRWCAIYPSCTVRFTRTQTFLISQASQSVLLHLWVGVSVDADAGFIVASSTLISTAEAPSAPM